MIWYNLIISTICWSIQLNEKKKFLWHKCYEFPDVEGMSSYCSLKRSNTKVKTRFSSSYVKPAVGAHHFCFCLPLYSILLLPNIKNRKKTGVFEMPRSSHTTSDMLRIDPVLLRVPGGMCNVRSEMTLMPAASCSPALNPSHLWASNLIFASIGDTPPVFNQ